MTENNNDTLHSHCEAFFKKTSVGIIIVNQQGIIVNINPFAEKMFMYLSEELLQQKLEILIPAQFRKSHPQQRDAYFEKPETRPMGIGRELSGQKKDGSLFPIEVSLNHYEINHEHFVVAFVTDITKRSLEKKNDDKQKKQLEIAHENKNKELRRTTSVLEILNERLETALAYQKAILDNASVMLFVMNRKGLIKFFNPEASRITGYQNDEVIDKCALTQFLPKTAINKFKNELKSNTGVECKTDIEVIIEKIKRNELKDIECSIKNKKGRYVPVTLSVTPIHDKNNEIKAYMGLAMDTTERKKTEQDLLKALEKEKELGNLKSRFVSMASHEFRTPLSTILSSTYLALKYTLTEEQTKREKHLNRITHAANLMTDILNDFLNVGRIEEGKIMVRLEDFNIKKLIEKTISDIHPNTKSGQKIFFTHVGNTEAHLDSNLFKNILNNLLTNAIKFSPEESVINITTLVSDSQITLTVQDRGIGISEEDKKHLMERFYRGANAINIQGTGLGMHIVSKYVERLNGTISYQSTLNKGTTFHLVFNKLI